MLIKFAMTIAVFYFTLLTHYAFGQLSTATIVTEKKQEASSGGSISEVLDNLIEIHKEHGDILIEQNKLDPLISKQGGGACPIAAAVVAYQAMLVMEGMGVDQNPYKTMVAAFANDPSLLSGRLSNTQFVKLIEFFGEMLEGKNVAVDVISAPNSPHAVGGMKWSPGEMPNLDDQTGVLRILSYTVTLDSGEVLGRHFVLQHSYKEGKLKVIDPNAILKDYHYTIENDQAGLGRVFLRFPPGKKFPRTNELNTIFEIRVNQSIATKHYTPTDISSVARIQTEIDSLANELESTDDLRSPCKWRSRGSLFGLPALDLPAEFGGANWPAVKMLEVFRHAGRLDLNLRDVVGGAHGRVLLRSLVPEVRDVVQQVADGKAYVAIAITEPTAGSDYKSMQSNCTEVEGGYLLNGDKRYNARLDQATHVIVFTKSNSGIPERLNVFLLPIDAEGLHVKRFGAHGLTGNSYGGIVMQDVFVPKSHLIGNEDDGFHIFKDHFRYWRLMQTAAALGTAERALEMMAERLKTRKVFGGPIGRFTHLQQPLGEYHIKLRMAHSLAKEAAQLLDQKKYKQADILIDGLKAEGIEIALGAVDSAVRAYGGEGYSDRVDLGDRLRDLNGLRIADGTTDVMRSSVVAKIYGKEFWEMAIKRSE